AGRADRIPQAGAVEMNGEAALTSPLADRFYLLDRIDAAAAAVVRVLQADEPRFDEVRIVGIADLVLELAEIKDAVVAVERPARHAGEDRGAAGFIVVDVAIEIAQQLVARLRVDVDGELIRHRPRRHVQGRFLA